MEFEVATEVPEAEEFCALRIATGLSPRDPAVAADALPKSLFSVTIRDDGTLIGMGRVVGDGLHAMVVDIAVHPDFQGMGLSRRIMDEVMAFVATLPRGTFVGLFADVDWLYDKFGFVVPEHTTGMSLEHWPGDD